MRNIRLKFLLLPATAALCLAGCMVGPRYHRPDATPQPPPPSYKESPTQVQDAGPWKVAEPQDAMLRGKWWEIFNDPELNSLEDQLNINNQNIKQFFENFMEARTLVAEARAQLYPTLSTSPTTYQRSRTSSNLTNSSSANTGRQSSTGTLGLAASWVPDLWGRVRNTIHEAQY